MSKRRFVISEDVGDDTLQDVLRVTLIEKMDPKTGVHLVKARIESPSDDGRWDGSPSGHHVLRHQLIAGGDAADSADILTLGRVLNAFYLKRQARKRKVPAHPRVESEERASG